MPQFDSQHEFLKGLPLNHPIYKSVFMLVARRDGLTYPAGSACLVAPGYLVTAKHVLRHIKKKVAEIDIDESSPEVIESRAGPDWDLLPSYGVGVDALQVQQDGQTRVFAVQGYVKIDYKYTDLAILKIASHQGYDHPDRTEWHSLTLDLVPPMAGREIFGFGFPDDDRYRLVHPDPFLNDYIAYQSSGVVEQVNLEDNLRNFQTSMKTVSGLSGGPVFVKRGDNLVFCGVVSRGGGVDYSFIAPLWQLAWATTSMQPNLPHRDGVLLFADLLHQNIMPSIGSEHITVYKRGDGQLSCRFDDQELLKRGY